MKAIRFLPLAYLADNHGFILFTAYAIVVLVAAQIIRLNKISYTLKSRTSRAAEEDGKKRPQVAEIFADRKAPSLRLSLRL